MLSMHDSRRAHRLEHPIHPFQYLERLLIPVLRKARDLLEERRQDVADRRDAGRAHERLRGDG